MMLYRNSVRFCCLLLLSVVPAQATLATVNSILVAAADSPSAPNNGADDTKAAQNSDTKGAAATKTKQFERPARREPEPLTPMGAVGLVLIITAIGTFTYFALRPMSQSSSEEEDPEQE
ncbi:MAG: hypothetical protein AAF310_03295 [Myxococcota bacterium]